jgi:hypothetical protein
MGLPSVAFAQAGRRAVVRAPALTTACSLLGEEGISCAGSPPAAAGGDRGWLL